jgi:hypothetical protein
MFAPELTIFDDADIFKNSFVGMSSFPRPSPYPFPSQDGFGGLGKGKIGFYYFLVHFIYLHLFLQYVRIKFLEITYLIYFFPFQIFTIFSIINACIFKNL